MLSKFVFSIILLFGVLFIVSSIYMLNHEVWRRMISNRLHNTYENRIQHQAQSYCVRQHGKYWLVLNYYNPRLLPTSSKENVTLVTHGTYKDNKLLDDLVKIWSAPISITLFVNGLDYELTVESIQRLHKCSTNRDYIKKYVTFNLCIHEDHFPDVLPKFKDVRMNVQCSKPDSNSIYSYWIAQKLDYPINLLRNIGRSTVATYYIFPLDLDYWPFQRLSEHVMKTIESHDMAACRENVFCVPIYKSMPLKNNVFRQYQLSAYQKYTVTISDLNIKWQDLELTELLYRRAFQSEVEVYKGTYDPNECGEYIIGANKWLPLDDERIYAGNPYNLRLKFGMLEDLHFSYILLRGTGVIHVAESSYTQSLNTDLINATQLRQTYDYYLNQWKELLNLK